MKKMTPEQILKEADQLIQTGFYEDSINILLELGKKEQK